MSSYSKIIWESFGNLCLSSVNSTNFTNILEIFEYHKIENKNLSAPKHPNNYQPYQTSIFK
jgi:hypothetical protein